MKKNNIRKRNHRGSAGLKQRPDESVALFQRRREPVPGADFWISDGQSESEHPQGSRPTSLWRDDGGESGEEV